MLPGHVASSRFSFEGTKVAVTLWRKRSEDGPRATCSAQQRQGGSLSSECCSGLRRPCFRPVSNRGPFACEANVITTTLRKPLRLLAGLVRIVIIYFLESERKEVQRRLCIGRESNPGLPRGRRESYHWTTNARYVQNRAASHLGGPGFESGRFVGLKKRA